LMLDVPTTDGLRATASAVRRRAGACLLGICIFRLPVTGDSTMTFDEAARRRDFTINAIGWDPLTDEYLDPFRGRDDLQQRILRVVDPKTFPDDSLRVLRALQFSARFDLRIDPDTARLCSSIALDDLWGERDAARTVARLNEAPTSQAKFALLERTLLDVAFRPLARHPAATFALAALKRDSSVRSSADVARELQMSQRRFIQIFRDEIGLTPKLYARIERLQAVLRRIELLDDVDWADVASSCGYFDQSHFIHDFREFTGLRPSDYLGLRIAGQRNHVRVPD